MPPSLNCVDDPGSHHKLRRPFHRVIPVRHRTARCPGPEPFAARPPGPHLSKRCDMVCPAAVGGPGRCNHGLFVAWWKLQEQPAVGCVAEERHHACHAPQWCSWGRCDLFFESHHSIFTWRGCMLLAGTLSCDRALDLVANQFLVLMELCSLKCAGASASLFSSLLPSLSSPCA